MKRIALTLAALVALSVPAAADPMDGVAAFDILPGWRTDRGTHMAAVRITLAPGWKTYWRAPGDAGIPPQFQWDGSQNIDAAQFHWPIPELMNQNGMRSIGYHGDVIIPIELSVRDAGEPVRMRGAVQIGVCEQICVPMSFEFDAILPASGSRDVAIIAALADRPQTQAEAGVGNVTCAISPTEDGLQITTRVPTSRAADAVVIEAGNDAVWVSEPSMDRAGGIIVSRAEMIHMDGGAFALDRSAVRITLLSQGSAVDIRGCVAGS